MQRRVAIQQLVSILATTFTVGVSGMHGHDLMPDKIDKMFPPSPKFHLDYYA